MKISRLLVVLGALLFVGRAEAQSWDTTFAPQLLASSSVPLSSVVVVPAGTDPERSVAARAFTNGLRASGRATLVMDASALGDVGELDDRGIVFRASSLPVTTIAVVRTFLGDPGHITAVVTVYDKVGNAVGTFSGERGMPLAVMASQPPPQQPGYEPLPQYGAQPSVATPELTQLPGTVPMTFTSEGRPLQLYLPDGRVYGNAYALSPYGFSFMSFRSVCQTPCTLYFPPGTTQLRVGGEGIRPSTATFETPPTGADLRLRAPSAGQFAAGYVLVTAGPGLLVSGIVTIALAINSNVTYTTDGFHTIEHHSNNVTELAVGGVLTGVGAVLMGTGIGLLVANRSGVASSTPRGYPKPTAKLMLGAGNLTVRGTF